MKLATIVCSTLLCLTLPGSTLLAHAQNPIPFKHIVWIIQENRTPDNLFGAAPSWAQCGQPLPFEHGVDIRDGGPDGTNGGTPRCLSSTRLAVCWDIDHSHAAWDTQADIQIENHWPVAKMDMACRNLSFKDACQSPVPDCPQYSFVQKSDVQPYFDIALNYGFANYMFGTHQGPSFPAHQFTLSGTSAPAALPDPNYLFFVAENGNYGSSGCPSLADNPTWVDSYSVAHPGTHACYDHPTLVDQLRQHVTWRYYTPTPGVIWTAINAIKHLCYKNNHEGQPCDSADWDNVVWPGKVLPPSTISVPVLYDIDTCQLQGVSWVIPDERWSDHPSLNDNGGGPSYVASIVNAIGNSGCVDTINGQNYTYWQDTAIFIVWDEWGGFYDHVAPFNILREYPPGQGTTDCSDPTQTWGCGYTYGIRVPLLVVSAYTPPGYVSGALPPYGPGTQDKYIHDFGSILRFIENNFGLGYIAPGYYADYNARDNTGGNLPLSEFFQGPYRTFTPIQQAVGMDGSYFRNYFATHPTEAPLGPDGGDAD